jgi:hypothetical protein
MPQCTPTRTTIKGKKRKKEKEKIVEEIQSYQIQLSREKSLTLPCLNSLTMSIIDDSFTPLLIEVICDKDSK